MGDKSLHKSWLQAVAVAVTATCIISVRNPYNTMRAAGAAAIVSVIAAFTLEVVQVATGCKHDIFIAITATVHTHIDDVGEGV